MDKFMGDLEMMRAKVAAINGDKRKPRPKPKPKPRPEEPCLS